MSLHVPSHGGGVVLLGSPDAQRTDELRAADSYDIGPRGQLVAASDASEYTTLPDRQATPVPFSHLYSLDNVVEDGVPYTLGIGRGKDGAGVQQFYAALIARSGEPATLASGFVGSFSGPTPVPPDEGTIVTVVQMPGTFEVGGGFRYGFVLINLGAREGSTPRSNGGLYAADYTPGSGKSVLSGAMSALDSLGTGFAGELVGGTKAKPLFFRGIAAYNGYVMGWGFENDDALQGEGPNRIMFCNPNNPLKWGNDDQGAVGVDRDFTDSDAIVIGDAGEIVRAGLTWNKRFWIGTNRELHYIGGTGRDTFLSDGSNHVADSHNVLGARCLIEGPDKLLHGVGDVGHWAYDGASFAHYGEKLYRFGGRSNGWWDLIWTDESAPVGYPGKTNQDLVWMASDWERSQVVIGIPFCNASSGAGAGTDTVIIKFHTRSKGYTRQVFPGIAITAAAYVRRLGQQREARQFGVSTVGAVTVQQYAYQATPTSSPMMPAELPLVTFGPYLPFGPDGEGIVRRAYLKLAWETAASLPLVFTITTTGDDAVVDTFTLTVSPTAPASPVSGDLWLDTSQSNTSLGNASAGSSVPATGGYLTKTYSGTAWRIIPGSGEKGLRGGIPMPLTRRKACEVTYTAQCTSAAGRYQCEGIGLNPGGGTHDA